MILVLVTFSFICDCQNKKENTDKISLWPEIEPFKSGYLKVSDIHEIYYELCGNPQGKPVFVIHRGPGSGCSPVMRQYFNPEKFLIVLLHQLGHFLLKENRLDDAIKVFLKNVQEYPNSFMANDALAETYFKKGENKLAIKYFKEAVKLNPDYDYGREMIKRIENNK